MTVAEQRATEMCGGCGNSDAAKRCIGCLHDFSPAAPTLSEQADALTALERLRLHVHDHETFLFSPEDAEEILEEYEVALAELQHRREAEADDGMSCSCGGGSLVGHASGCPEAAASPSSPASGVRVKALEWVERHDGWQADTVIGIYMVLAVRALPKPFEVLGPRSYIGLSDDEVSGKAAAQAHFDAAIRSALGEHP